MLRCAAPSPGSRPAPGSFSSLSSLPSPPSLSISAEGPFYPHTPPPILLPYPPLLNPPIPLLHRPSILLCHCSLLGTFNPGPLHHRLPRISNDCQCVRSRTDHLQYTLAVQNEGTDSTVVDSKKRRKVSTDRHESKQAQWGTGVNIDCRCAPQGIAMLWVSLPRQGAAMTTISMRTTRIIGERRLAEIMIKRRSSKNGNTTPYEICGS